MKELPSQGKGIGPPPQYDMWRKQAKRWRRREEEEAVRGGGGPASARVYSPWFANRAYVPFTLVKVRLG